MQHLNRLELVNFKNLEHIDLYCIDGLNCFVGTNGQGKTNLLDAVYYLCLTKNFNNLFDKELIRKGTDFFRAIGEFTLESNEPCVIKAIVALSRKKQLFANQVPYQKITEHVGKLPVVMIAPNDVDLVTEGSEERRKLFDNTLSQSNPDYLNTLSLYNNVLEQRNALLKTHQQNKTIDFNLLDVYDLHLIPLANKIYNYRTAFVQNFKPTVEAYYKQLSNGNENLQITYKSALQNLDIQSLLSNNRAKDLILGRTSAGVHKDDLDLLMTEMPLKRFGSQGQLKSATLSIKLAQFDYLKAQLNKTPILLLDDIFDKLDLNRVKNLLEIIENHGFGQVFLTDTQKFRVEQLKEVYKKNCLIHEVINGAIPAQGG